MNNASDDAFLAEDFGEFPNRYQNLTIRQMGDAGVVIQATDAMLKRPVAIKVLKNAQISNSESERFNREAKILANFTHANIVKIFSAGQTSKGNLYHATEWIDGIDLSSASAKSQLSDSSRFFDLFLQLFSALAYAHSFNIVHRDIKPRNIMLRAEPLEGLSCTPVFVDFGLGKYFKQGDSNICSSGAIQGNPTYLSPEVCNGLAATASSDIYSLACVMYEFLAGAPPFKSDDQTSLIQHHINSPVPKLKVDNSFKNVVPLIQQCLSKNPEKRPSAEECYQKLKEAYSSQPMMIRQILSQKSLLWLIPLIAILLLSVGTVQYILKTRDEQTKKSKSQITETRNSSEYNYLNSLVKHNTLRERRLSVVRDSEQREPILKALIDGLEEQALYEQRLLYQERKNNSINGKLNPAQTFAHLATLCKTNNKPGNYAMALRSEAGAMQNDPDKWKEVEELYSQALAISATCPDLIKADVLDSKGSFALLRSDFAEFSEDMDKCLAIWKANYVESPTDNHDTDDVASHVKATACAFSMAKDLDIKLQARPRSVQIAGRTAVITAINKISQFLIDTNCTKSANTTELAEGLVKNLAHDTHDYQKLMNETKRLSQEAHASKAKKGR